MPANTAPTFATIGTDTEPSDAAIGALARLLLSVADHDDTQNDNRRNHSTGAAIVKTLEATNADYHIDD